MMSADVSKPQQARTTTRYARVAVVQLAYHPAVSDALDDPLFDPKRDRHSLLPDSSSAPEDVQAAHTSLRSRVRKAYVEQLGRRIDVILAHCQKWSVQLVVFPEYSIPAELLERFAQKAPDIVIVAGTHFVEAEGLRSKVYERLGASSKPHLRNAVCPVLYQGKALSMGAKVHAVKEEQRLDFVSGKAWNSVNMPASFESPMGILICRDFLQRDTTEHRAIIAEKLASCRFLAVPSLTPGHSLDEFAAKCWEQARREHRPVLYANDASGGGTSLYVDEGRQLELQDYPTRAGLLSRHEEGIIVADVDLGYDRAGTSTPYEKHLPVKPFAAATFVYRGLHTEYAEWLDRLAPLLDTEEGDEFDRLEAIREFVEHNAPPLGHATATREHRLRRLLHDINNLSGIDFVRKLTREVVFPADVLPMPALRAAMARGAADVVRGFFEKREQNAKLGAFVTVEAVQKAGADKEMRLVLGANAEMHRAMGDVTTGVRGGQAEPTKRATIWQLERMHKTLTVNWNREFNAADDAFDAFNYEAAEDKYRQIEDEAAQISTGGDILQNNESNLRIVHRCRLKRAACLVNTEAYPLAHELLRNTDEQFLSEEERLALVDLLRFVDEIGRAKSILITHVWEHISAKRLAKTDQLLDIETGELPEMLIESALVHVCTASLFLFRREDAQGSFEYALSALKLGAGEPILMAQAVDTVVEALHRTIFEVPPTIRPIPLERRAEAVDLIEKHILLLHDTKLPTMLRNRLEDAEDLFRGDTLDSDDARPSRLNASDDTPDPSRMAYRIARQGRIQEALEALPHLDHPWHGALDRLTVFRSGGDFDGWRREALIFVEEFRNKAPLEYEAAWALASAGLFEEALPHAERAFQALPGIGQRCKYAEVLVELDRHQEAWTLLAPLRMRADTRVWKWKVLARAAEMADPSNAHDFWRKYTEHVPEDLSARLHFAGHLFAQHDMEEAAAVTWKVFEEHRNQLSLDGVARCAQFQQFLDPRDGRRQSRLLTVMQWIREQFAGNPQAEMLFLLLRNAAGIVNPTPDQKVDIALFEQATGVQRFEGIEPLRALMARRNTIAETTSQWLRHGKIPVTTACALNHLPLAAFVQQILMRRRKGTVLLCAPITVTDELPLSDLSGQSLLVSDLEVLLLDVLGLVEPLRKALGKTGQLVLFQHTHERIIADAARFRQIKGIDKPLWEVEDTDQIEIAERRESARLADSVHQWVANGLQNWIRILPDRAITGLPALREPTNEVTQEIILEPFQEMLAYREALIDNPTLLWMTGEFYSIGAASEPEITFAFAWPSAEHYLEYCAHLRSVANRMLHVPQLVRLLRVDVFDKLRLLAELGFGDALGAEELIRLADPREFGGLEKDEPNRLLTQQSWAAREPDHTAGDMARIRLAYVYANAIVRFVIGEGDPEKVDDGIPFRQYEHGKTSALTLLGHIEQIGHASDSNALDLLLHTIVLRALDLWRLVLRRDDDHYVTRDRSLLDDLWKFLQEWAGEDGSRNAAYRRCLRFVWSALDRMYADGPNLARAEVLFRIRPQFSSGKPIEFMRPDVEASTVLSACWTSCPLPGFQLTTKDATTQVEKTIDIEIESLLEYGAGLLGTKDGGLRGNERSLFYSYPVPGGHGTLRILAPTEALLLRASRTSPERMKLVIPEFQSWTGPHDGVAYGLLSDLAENPADASTRRAVARHAAIALWRIVRDDPAFLAYWPHQFDANGEKPTLDTLRDLLSEPRGPFPDAFPHEFLQTRMAEGGAWHRHKRSDYWQLLRMATEVPGNLASLPAMSLLRDKDYAKHVSEALWRLDHADEVPAARLAGAVLFLRLAAAQKNLVALSSGTIDLRETLPEHFERLLRALDIQESTAADLLSNSNEPTAQNTDKTNTFATHEPSLLRVCAAVVQRLASPGALPIREGLWLTWRLFQWLCRQFDALDPDARRDGMKRLAALAPKEFGEPVDRLDPFGFGKNKFDHRLAAVLHAMQMVVPAPPDETNASPQEKVQARRISSKGLEEKLRELADRHPESASLSSVLDWNAPDNVPDLALLTLLRSKLTAFGDLRAETRKRHFETLPLDPDATNEFGLPEGIVGAVSLTASHLETDERGVLVQRLRAMKDGPKSRLWRWMILTGLFAAGEVDLETEVKSLLVAHSDKKGIVEAYAGLYLLTIAALSLQRLEAATDELLHAFGDNGGDVSALALAVGNVCLYGSPESKNVARGMLVRLVKQRAFGDDLRVQRLLGSLGLNSEVIDD